MARLPFIGRLTLNDYARILFTYLFFFLEMIARGVLALFSPITGLLDWLRSLVIGYLNTFTIKCIERLTNKQVKQESTGVHGVQGRAVTSNSKHATYSRYCHVSGISL